MEWIILCSDKQTEIILNELLKSGREALKMGGGGRQEGGRAKKR